MDVRLDGRSAIITGASKGLGLAMAKEFAASGADVVNIQHEYGLFGGEEGEWVVDLIRGVCKPVVTSLHTVLPEPSPEHRRVARAPVRTRALRPPGLPEWLVAAPGRFAPGCFWNPRPCTVYCSATSERCAGPIWIAGLFARTTGH